jgi:hypothetical protein
MYVQSLKDEYVGSGSVSVKSGYKSKDPDLYENLTDPEHRCIHLKSPKIQAQLTDILFRC